MATSKKDQNRDRAGVTPGGRKYKSWGSASGNRVTAVSSGNSTHIKWKEGKARAVGNPTGAKAIQTTPIKKSFTKPVKKK